jgi:predicted AlkP superfamily pyrophosphatase or phosphodiesterase
MLPDMRAIFIAHGPAFRHGVTLPAFDNVDVYPLLARITGVTPQKNDGDPATLAAALSP